MIVVFIGPPFAGKGTQATLLNKALNLPVFSMGAIIREEYKKGNSLAVKGFEEYSMKGAHVPIELKFGLLKERLDKTDKGFILDNFPATAEDLSTFSSYLRELGKEVDRVFNLLVSEEEMKKRMSTRGRADDNPQILQKRRLIQDKDRDAVIAYYKVKGILVDINGEGDIQTVHKEIMRRLKGQ